MPEYQLELKQIVEYPRCRIYRQFIRTLMEDRSIRVSGGSGLFYFTALCSYANFRTSYKRIGGISYTVYPGEWVCRVEELTAWFRCRFQRQALVILDELQVRHLITWNSLGRGKVIKFKITGWHRHNTVLDYNAPCQKDTGFFFMPVSTAAEIVSAGRCSEMDTVLDLWLNTVYNDNQVQGSDAAPVVYMRNGTGSPLIGYAELAERWGLSKATVGRLLKKLSGQGYLSLLTFPGKHGSVISLSGYLSTMFQISDVMIDKDEIALSLNIRLSISDDEPLTEDESTLSEEQLCVSPEISCVSKPHIRRMLEKVAGILSAQGIPCFDCPKSHYILSPLCGCGEVISEAAGLSQAMGMTLTVRCGGKDAYRFEIALSRVENQSFRRLS
ncbi:MAG: MarR family transcriptional regulator [Oscillospiraceae bacterium]|jgi:hypothetical protein|nr:MarR family transcriptional regulator [Oscillospiraceae bacterium]